MWYANRVRADSARSLVAAVDAPAPGAGVAVGTASGNPAPTDPTAAPELTGRRKVVLVVFGLAFAIMIYGFVPWDDVWQNIFDTGGGRAARRAPATAGRARRCARRRPADNPKTNVDEGRCWNSSIQRRANAVGTSSTTRSSPFIVAPAGEARQRWLVPRSRRDRAGT
jgi:hypothetical protein